MADEGGVAWEPPGPGLWVHDPVHFPAPITGFVARTGMPGFSEGFSAGYARYGLPTLTVERRLINGWAFAERVPVEPALFAERERAATDAIEQRLWRIDGERWFEVERPKMIEECLAVQAVDPAALDDGELGAHLLDGLELLRRSQVHHFTHIAMVFVVGEWLLAADRWGLPSRDAYALLGGSSPATAAAARSLDSIAAALRAAGVSEVDSLDRIRAASADAARALDDYLVTYGWRTVSGFDIDALALLEMPEVIVASVRAALVAGVKEAEPDIASVRARVPEAERGEFDEVLAEARYVYGIRDDDVGPCMWARGLVRRALLDIASRLLARQALHDRDDVVEAGADELVDLLGGASSPDADELASRAELRRSRAALTPPPTMGTPPVFDAPLPPTVARVARASGAYMGGGSGRPASGGHDRLSGLGVGDRPYVGRARVASRVEDALARLEPGDVLVTTITTPAFNSVLSIAGALIVEFGGPTSHAAIMARELGIPAVVDARGCMTLIPDGAKVEVDPVEGRVLLV